MRTAADIFARRSVMNQGLWGRIHGMFIDGNSIVHKMDPDLPPEIAVILTPGCNGLSMGPSRFPQNKIGDDILIMGPGQRGAWGWDSPPVGQGKILPVTGLAADES